MDDLELSSEEVLWLTVVEHAENDLRREHAFLTRRAPLARALLDGTEDFSSEMQSKIRTFEEHFSRWREVRTWFTSADSSFRSLCVLLDIDIGRKRKQLWDYVHLEFNGLLAEAAIEQYKEALGNAREICREYADCGSKAPRRMGDKVRAARERFSRQDIARARRQDLVRRAKAARSKVARGTGDSS